MNEQPQRTFFYNSLGFTFIELLVVISLISFLSIVGVASFVEYSGVQTFNSGVQDVYTLLQRAKSNSLSQIKTSTCVTQGVLHGYRVSICDVAGSACSGLNQFELVAMCGGTDIDSAIPILIEGKRFSSDTLSFDISSSPTPQQTDKAWFLFTVLKGGVRNSSNSSSGTIVIQDTSGRTRTIVVDSLGTIAVN